MQRNKKSVLLVLLLAGFTFLLSRCLNSADARTDPRGPMYAGAATCRQCHQEIYDTYQATAHSNSTTAASGKNLLGNFEPGLNSFVYDSVTRVSMENRDSGHFQVLYEQGHEVAAYRFDILFGYRNAQTSVYWKDNKLYELPISHYSSVDRWGTSPGYPVAHPEFSRVVNSECLDCHSSNIQLLQGSSFAGEQQLDPASLITGIDCERCHGPAQNHVNFHDANSGERQARYMLKNAGLTRQQKLDACAVCHSGNDKMKVESRFQFKMGDTLSHYFMPFGGRTGAADVHGNQYGLLSQSACFKGSNLTCGNCHNPHTDAANSVTVFSRTCLTCHKADAGNFCPKFEQMGEKIKTNCIDCHMPKQASMAIRFQLEGSQDSGQYMLQQPSYCDLRQKRSRETSALRKYSTCLSNA